MKNMHARIYMDFCRHLLNWQIQIRANGITLKLRYASRTFNLLAIFRIPTKLFIRVCVCVFEYLQRICFTVALFAHHMQMLNCSVFKLISSNFVISTFCD